jgi:uncharacterized protein
LSTSGKPPFYLRSQGHRTSKTVVADYIRWLEDAYFLFTVRVYDASLSRSNANPKKIYCIDHAFVRSVTASISADEGHLLESLVFVALRRRGDKVYYYRTARGTEVDFLAQSSNGVPKLYQVCESLHASDTRARELAALELAMTEMNLSVGYIVTKDHAETVKSKSGSIYIVPAWKFLLAQDSSSPNV